MPTHSAVPSMAQGAFFGEPCHAVLTSGFQFSEFHATVPERQVPRHIHEAPHFILITQGIYLTEARNQTGLCSPGTFIFNPGGITHRDCFRSEKGKFLSISTGPSVSRLLDRASPVPIIIAGAGIRESKEPLIGNRILRELRGGLESSTLILEELAFELIGVLSGMEERTAARMPPRWLALAKEIVEDCDGSDLRIADLATAVAVHPVYLARAYRRHFGYSPGEHLRRSRLLRVQGLLTKTDLPLAEVALECGFSDQSQMTRSFSSYFGMPPARYRRLSGR